MTEYVTLVDDTDKELGKMEKLEAHQLGLLHRAFSVFIFNSKGELLMQQRASNKYHSAGLWTNTCCSHPRFGEETYNAALRRLEEEMGMACALTYGFNFIYKAEFENGLTEYEFDHVYFGTSDAVPKLNFAEVQNWKYVSLEMLKEEIKTNPHNYTEWLKICLVKVFKHINESNKIENID